MILFRDGQKVSAGELIDEHLRISQEGRTEMTLVCEGGGKACFEIDIDCPGAEFVMNGVFVCKGDDRLDVDVVLRHNEGGSISRQLFKGIADGNARIRFSGLVKVAPDAQKTEAYQTSRNLQLSDTAVVETLPQLEIYADDVKCSHGATVGTLNEDEQFYMRSRGISLAEARRLQMISFLAEAMTSLDEEVRQDILSRI